MSKLNPKIDLVFKKIFGTDENKDLLKSLINSVEVIKVGTGLSDDRINDLRSRFIANE